MMFRLPRRSIDIKNLRLGWKTRHDDKDMLIQNLEKKREQEKLEISEADVLLDSDVFDSSKQSETPKNKNLINRAISYIKDVNQALRCLRHRVSLSESLMSCIMIIWLKHLMLIALTSEIFLTLLFLFSTYAQSNHGCLGQCGSDFRQFFTWPTANLFTLEIT